MDLKIREAVEIALDRLDDLSQWDSLVINRREPFTYRAFTFVGDDRICLHKFDPCSEDNAFMHPHPWPSEMMVLSGVYEMWVGHSKDLHSKPDSVIDVTLSAGSIYKMHNELSWHSVRPLTTAYSIMINGLPWKDKHSKAPTTKGKDLDKFTQEELRSHLDDFRSKLKKEGGLMTI